MKLSFFIVDYLIFWKLFQLCLYLQIFWQLALILEE